MLGRYYVALDESSRQIFAESAVFLKSPMLLAFLRMESLQVYLNHQTCIEHWFLQLHLNIVLKVLATSQMGQEDNRSLNVKRYIFRITFHCIHPDSSTFFSLPLTAVLLSRRDNWVWWHSECSER